MGYYYLLYKYITSLIVIMFAFLFKTKIRLINYLKKNMTILFNLLEVLVVIVPMLLAVAFVTIVERKMLAAAQRRVGPNIVGVYGVLQPFADALKLVVKEVVVPANSNKVLFYLAPMATLIFSLLG